MHLQNLRAIWVERSARNWGKRAVGAVGLCFFASKQQVGAPGCGGSAGEDLKVGRKG